jgi:hypothetical protein
VQPRNSLEQWWRGLDEFTRRRVLRLHPADLLPADLAGDLLRSGVHVTRLRSSTSGDDVWAQPELLLELIERERQDGSVEGRGP